jgi:hypothetical protein
MNPMPEYEQCHRIISIIRIVFGFGQEFNTPNIAKMIISDFGRGFQGFKGALGINNRTTIHEPQIISFAKKRKNMHDWQALPDHEIH